MLEPGNRRVGLGVTLGLVVAGCLLQILLVPHELEGIESTRTGKPPDMEKVLAPRAALVITPPARMRARAPEPEPAVAPASAAIAASEEPLGPDEPLGVLEVTGPTEAFVGDLVTFSIVVHDARDAVYAPLLMSHDPAVLGYVSAEQGDLFSTGGAETQFIAAPSHLSGQVEIAISRVPPASGIEGGGILASATFLVLSAGESRIGVEGSRLIDPLGRTQAFEPLDAVLRARRADSGIEGDLE